jgi:hypothetical protein
MTDWGRFAGNAEIKIARYNILGVLFYSSDIETSVR